MIEYIKGTIAELTPARMVLECYGIGYEINISLTTFSAIQGKDECKVFIYEVIREDAHLLFGFAEPVERELFLLLTSVSGVGPNTARMILSSLQPAELIRVIATRDDRSLTAVKGIGTKTAERIVGRFEKQGQAGRRFGSCRYVCCAAHDNRLLRGGRGSCCRSRYAGFPEGRFAKGGYGDLERRPGDGGREGGERRA